MENVTTELLTKLKAAHPGASLYHFHKILGCSPQSIYQMDEGRRQMGADTILIICDVLGLDPQPYLLRAEIARSKSDHRRQILQEMLDRLISLAALLALGVAALSFPDFLAFSTI